MLGDEVLGVIHVGTLAPRDFTTDDIVLLQLVADRVARAIEHARAFEAERTARIRLESVQAVTDAALAHLELNPLLGALLPRIHDILSVDTVAVLLLDESTAELVATAAVGIEEEVEQGVRIPLGKGFAGRIAATREAVFLPDVDHADILNPILGQKGIKSLLGVPLLVGGETLGVLHIGSLTPRLFTASDRELLQLVAHRVAIAVERARLHEQTLELDHLKLNFVAIASHELRTPATSVYGIVATLRERRHTLDDDVVRQLEEALWEQSVRLRRLIEQLLDLSRLDAQSIHIEPRRIALDTLLGELLASVGVDDVRLEVEPSLQVIADPVAIERVVTNLVQNADRYGAPPVTVSARRDDSFVRIVVEDEGPGVAQELQPRLFDRFERGSQADQGTGLGLSIAKAYARAHGGDLLYDPRTGGARFEFFFPS
jgi:K+-sensing histidine kinase KdpD